MLFSSHLLGDENGGIVASLELNMDRHNERRLKTGPQFNKILDASITRLGLTAVRKI